jgi:hypothetical protein
MLAHTQAAPYKFLKKKTSLVVHVKEHCSGVNERHYMFTSVVKEETEGFVSKWFYDTFTGVATGAARYGSFVGGAQIARGVGYPGIRRTRRFTWFGSPERNTLRPRVNGVVLLYFSARLRSSLFSLSARVCLSSPVTVVCPTLL